MKQLYHLTLRHTVLFFKDKGRFLTALITPIVLIVLYMTFLGTIYHDSLDSIVKYFCEWLSLFFITCGELYHSIILFKYDYGTR